MPNADELYGSVLDSVASYAHRAPSYEVAVPSYRRDRAIADRTLATLDRLKVDRDRVTVFVADEPERDAYDTALDGEWRVVVGRPGLYDCRRWYANEYYPTGTPVLHFDDDVDDLLDRGDGKKLVAWDGSIDQLAALGFGMTEGVGARVWGITAVANAFYMADEAVAGLRYICGIVHGTIAGDTVSNPDGPAVSSGADFARSLASYVAYGSVVRLGWVAPKTIYFAPGGMQAELGGKEARARDHASALRQIARRHPGLAKLVQKKSGPNLRLTPKTVLRVPRSSLERALG